MGVLDAWVFDVVAVEGERRGRCVDGDEPPGAGSEMAREQPGPARQLEHQARDVEVVDGGFEAGGLFEPSSVALGAQVVGAAPVPDVVVLVSPILVIPLLLLLDVFEPWLHATPLRS